MKNNILAVILARGGSKGIPKKNIYNISGHPLLSYSLQAAKESRFINKIIVSTDSLEIAKTARAYGAETPFLRSKKLATDETTSVDALHDAVIRCEKIYKTIFDYVIELPCVSPLRDASDIDKALKILMSKRSYDSVISYVNTGEKHPTRLKRIVNDTATNFCKEYPEPDYGSRRQDFENCYIRNGAIYAMTRDCIVKQKSRNGKKSYPLIMTNKKSINIDEKFDLLLAELLIKNGDCKNFPKKKIINNKIIFLNKKKKKNLLITAPFFFINALKKKLLRQFNCTFISDVSKKNVIKNLINKDGWLCHPSPEYKIDKSLINKKSLKIIATPSTGTNHINLDHCKQNKIKVISILNNPKTKNIKASSEFTFLLILASLRKLILAKEKVQMGYWRNVEDELRGDELFNKKVGIIGYGRIGKNIGKFSKSFGAKVRAYDPYIINKDNKIIENDLAKLLKESDIIVISITFNKDNINFVGKNFLKNLKENCILINTSRGEVVNEMELIKALKSKKIKYAATDVVRDEQNLSKKNNKLIEYSKKNNNLLVTPHIAGLTIDSERKAAEITIDNLVKYFNAK